MARILVADDDELYREMIESMLTRDGHLVIGVKSGKGCLEQLDGGQFDLLITDLFMPHFDGLDLIAAVRSRNGTMPIIGITGGLSGLVKPYVEAMLAMGTQAVLAKPFTVERFADEVRKALHN